MNLFFLIYVLNNFLYSILLYFSFFIALTTIFLGQFVKLINPSSRYFSQYLLFYYIFVHYYLLDEWIDYRYYRERIHLYRIEHNILDRTIFLEDCSLGSKPIALYQIFYLQSLMDARCIFGWRIGQFLQSNNLQYHKDY
jgi:hypothetical protein